MKLFRRRKPSLKKALGITKAKRSISKVTGIPTTKSGRKRKALNMATGGAYGKYERTRAAVNRPYKTVKRPPSCMGCLVWALSPFAILMLVIVLFFSVASAEETPFFVNSKFASFLSSYNAIAKNKISNNELYEGNVDGKYAICRDDVEWTVYAYEHKRASLQGIHITISAKAKNDAILYDYFKDILRTLKPEIHDEEIKKIWDYAKSVAAMEFIDRLYLDNDQGLFPTEIDRLAVSYFSLINRSTGLYTFHVTIHDETYQADEQ